MTCAGNCIIRMRLIILKQAVTCQALISKELGAESRSFVPKNTKSVEV